MFNRAVTIAFRELASGLIVRGQVRGLVLACWMLLGISLQEARGNTTDAEAAFGEGLRLRERGEGGEKAFEQAGQLLDARWREGPVNPWLARNRGNAWLLAGDLPRAILAYREGLRLAPDDGALRELLTHAREQVLFPDGSARGRPHEEFASGERQRFWEFLVGSGIYLAGFLLLARACLLRRRALVAFSLAGLLGGGMLLGMVGWWQANGTARPCVVLARDGVLLRKGDSQAFPPWFEVGLNRGVEASLLTRRGDWLQIELASGEVGWIPAGEALVETE